MSRPLLSLMTGGRTQIFFRETVHSNCRLLSFRAVRATRKRVCFLLKGKQVKPSRATLLKPLDRETEPVGLAGGGNPGCDAHRRY